MAENYSNYNIGAYVNQGPDLSVINSINDGNASKKQQLKKVANEFEAIFTAKMFSTLDKTVDRENSLFQETKYMDNLKSIIFNDIGRQIANSPSSIGIAKQIYEQTSKSIKE